ncbi:MAG: ABC transporter ATP-binding protein/permease [Ruminococcaceae bacterium]|nr:ABC transporter ATP-binding protein/permease [Oscillospiraceae bacterium]
MLSLTNICKTYLAGDSEVQALRSVSLRFRKSEFVSVLGPSGCGKTTLLNIIGGLDRYTDGQLSVDGIPTSEFKDRDWDSYRNHSIGFVFQSYNLIPHQTVLANVELALTLSGVSKAERRRRAEDALKKVGLGDQLKKKPNQMSGGQMQRVAIARALVNDPDILLADEPTGALDSETSVQIMEILREIAEDKLIIMVTHNPELAEKYSSRIIRLLDGSVISDSNPYSEADEAAAKESEKQRTKKEKFSKTQMSFLTALGLSTNNLMTKKGRTLLTAFAGSIGIIGIALILSLSHGINLYIDKVQEDTLSTYPITIQKETVDMASLMNAMMGAGEASVEHEEGKVYSSTLMHDLMDSMMSADVHANNLTDFRTYIESEESGFLEHTSSITYKYGVPPTIYAADTAEKLTKVNPPDLFSDMMPRAQEMQSSGGMTSLMATSGTMSIWSEMIDNEALLDEQYDVVAGRWPHAYNEVVLVIDQNNEINDVYLYALGLKDSDELTEMMQAVSKGEPFNAESTVWTYEDLLNLEFKLVLPTDSYKKQDDGTWKYMGENESYMKVIVDEAETVRVVGIIRPDPAAVATSLQGAIGYTAALTEYVINKTNDSALVKEQLANEGTDVITGLPFDDGTTKVLTEEEQAEAIRSAMAKMTSAERAAIYTASVSEMSEEDAQRTAAEQAAAMSPEQLNAVLTQAMTAQTGMDEASVAGYIASMSEDDRTMYAMAALSAAVKEQYAAETQAVLGTKSTDELSAMLDGVLSALSDADVAKQFADYMPDTVSESTYEENLTLFGYADLQKPTSILIYCDTFEAKDIVSQMIDDYNKACLNDGRDEDIINYTDYVALMMSSISTIINVISYVLIAFVSISLVVSSIMIGIITYISVLERTKEIGILRSIGASKKDISRVFNAETLIIGFTAGAIGIIVTLLLCIPANMIIETLTDIPNLAKLPTAGAVILILISTCLTMIAGLIPSRVAAKKDPVIALRTE